MNPILKRLRSRAARTADSLSALGYTLALPVVLAMAVLAKEGGRSKGLEIIKANYGVRKEKVDELRSIDEAAAGRAYTEEENSRVEELRGSLTEVDNRVMSLLEQEIRAQQIDGGVDNLLGAMLDRESGEIEDTRSLGEKFVDLDGVRSWIDAGARGTSPALNVEMDLRAVTNVTLGATSGGALTRPERLARIGNDFLNRRVFLSDLLPHIPVGQGSVEYVQDQSPLADLADAAREVAEAAAKPQAGPTLAVVTEPVPVVAAWANITRQTAADVPQVMGYLDTRLRYALRRRVDAQSINGDGVSPNIRGLLNRTGIVAYAPGVAEARYLSIRRAIRLLEDVESVPEIIVLNPSDAELFDISNHNVAGLHANPDQQGGFATAGTRTAWGLQQVRSTAVAAGTALLIDPMALAFLDRMQVTAFMTDSHASNFTSNILTLLLETRVGLALFEPKGVAKITFNGTA
jgi:HK97 family phage major capsid protein